MLCGFSSFFSVAVESLFRAEYSSMGVIPMVMTRSPDEKFELSDLMIFMMHRFVIGLFSSKGGA
jgi:hypothetical protein